MKWLHGVLLILLYNLIKTALIELKCELSISSYVFQKVSNYLKGLDVQLEGFENLSENTAVCLACEVCPGPSVIIVVNEKHINRLEQEGFYVVAE